MDLNTLIGVVLIGSCMFNMGYGSESISYANEVFNMNLSLQFDQPPVDGKTQGKEIFSVLNDVFYVFVNDSKFDFRGIRINYYSNDSSGDNTTVYYSAIYGLEAALNLADDIVNITKNEVFPDLIGKKIGGIIGKSIDKDYINIIAMEELNESKKLLDTYVENICAYEEHEGISLCELGYNCIENNCVYKCVALLGDTCHQEYGACYTDDIGQPHCGYDADNEPPFQTAFVNPDGPLKSRSSNDSDSAVSMKGTNTRLHTFDNNAYSPDVIAEVTTGGKRLARSGELAAPTTSMDDSYYSDLIGSEKYKNFNPKLEHIDTKADYSIRRPMFSSEPIQQRKESYDDRWSDKY